MDFFFTHPCAFLSTGSLESLESLRTLKREREREINSQVHQSEEGERDKMRRREEKCCCSSACWVTVKRKADTRWHYG